jgi:hypothetical protein
MVEIRYQERRKSRRKCLKKDIEKGKRERENLKKYEKW